MDNESQVIERQMEQTRTSLQDKLETLEQQVKNTVQDATEAVSETVESVKDAVQETVSTVKDTVQGTVETVKESVQGTVDSVKETFNLSHQVDAHPWGMFLGAAAVGFVATRWLTGERSGPSATAGMAPLTAAPTYQTGSPVAGNGHTSAAPASSQAEERSSWWSWIADHYSEELNKVKGLALGTAGGVIRDMLLASASPALAEQIKEVVDGVTAKLGGQVVEGPILSFDDPKDGI
jgi:ElaB/YqjD/DUF883 family membrane-anchored ribosome-binding protein